MDDLAHEFPLNHRKRKADNDDRQDSASNDPDDGLLSVDTSAVAPPPLAHAPRLPWLAQAATSQAPNPAGMWSAPTSPQVSSPLTSQVMFEHHYPHSTKRPRIDNKPDPSSSSRRRFTRRPASKPLPSRPPPTLRHGSDVEDIGLVSNADPGPSSGSLLRLRDAGKHSDPAAIPHIPIDSNSPHIPSLQPLINRHTLKELDLDTILRNPQLRHDLLFDPGLQFRPTSSRRKRDIAEKYWVALTRELESGKPHPLVCACAQVPMPASNPVVAFSPSLNVLTLRMPSRIPTLLSEFLEVLLLVIQPLSSISGMYVNPNTFKSQMQEHSAQAAHIRSVFDPILIEQELKHRLFDPSGLFQAIGLTLKGHCAPMRDQAVELMVHTAQSCAPGGGGTKADAVKAVRMCMEILELMKLDIANHQLQTLRPFLIRTSGQYELKTFKNRKGSDCSLRITREWLRAAHKNMLTHVDPIPHPLYPPGHLKYSTLQRNQQTYLAVLKGFVDLVFSPQTPMPSSALSPLPGFPETSYLDSARLLLLGTDAADATALCMFLLLFRQLAHAAGPAVTDPELAKLKTEIRDIGASRLALSPSGEISAQPDPSPLLAPDERTLALAQRWVDTNMHPDAPLGALLHDRLREAVFTAVVALAYPARDAATGRPAPVDLTTLSQALPPGAARGVEALADEVRALAEKIARVALIHLNAFLPLYEQDGFWEPEREC
ncbi:T-complex protein 11-domain-containing protein [Infundibulicybe gibba]|nr:T-complex protein 11-domain-containing protein [Infundibulicybe gibba]